MYIWTHMETWHQFSTVFYLHPFYHKKQAENSDERVNPDAHLLHFFENYRSFGSYGHNPPIIPRPEMPICQVSVQIVEQCLRESMALFWTGCACLNFDPQTLSGIVHNCFPEQIRWTIEEMGFSESCFQICHIIIYHQGCFYILS